MSIVTLRTERSHDRKKRLAFNENRQEFVLKFIDLDSNQSATVGSISFLTKVAQRSAMCDDTFGDMA
jgi:hypothetical protein